MSEVSDDPTIAVVNAPERGRYEIRVDGELAGFATYKARPDQIAFKHTEVEDRFEGRGLAGRLFAGDVENAVAAPTDW